MTSKIIVLAATSLFATSMSIAAQNTLSASDKKFIDNAADIDMLEAHLGQMAQNQASSAEVKNFGQTLEQDHSKAYGQLLELGDKIHEQVPRGIDVRKQAAFNQLHNAKGAAFDRRFAADQVRDHEKALNEFKREAEHGQNADVKSYANQQIPTLEEHLHKAQELARSSKHRS
jgi:putative membrane protein